MKCFKLGQLFHQCLAEDLLQKGPILHFVDLIFGLFAVILCCLEVDLTYE